MADTSAHLRYRQDAILLAEIGRALIDQLPPITVRIPSGLADRAVRACQRDELVAMAETSDQAIVRDLAAVLALIGLAIGDTAIEVVTM